MVYCWKCNTKVRVTVKGKLFKHSNGEQECPVSRTKPRDCRRVAGTRRLRYAVNEAVARIWDSLEWNQQQLRYSWVDPLTERLIYGDPSDLLAAIARYERG